MERAEGVVRRVRDVCHRMNIARPRILTAPVSALVEAAGRMLHVRAETLRHLAGLARREIAVGAARPKRAATVVVGAVEAHLPLAGGSDVAAEGMRPGPHAGRIEAQLVQARAQPDRVCAAMGDPGVA